MRNPSRPPALTFAIGLDCQSFSPPRAEDVDSLLILLLGFALAHVGRALLPATFDLLTLLSAWLFELALLLGGAALPARSLPFLMRL